MNIELNKRRVFIYRIFYIQILLALSLPFIGVFFK